ncbi:MAG: DUF2179 domain-containing protein [Acidobacteria bacterium]|nr:DUF2179 domain-containing protein [Acidobacteriota bacterium]
MEPLLIALARVCDVSLGTLRVISIARGRKVLAPILGFFEVLIWLVAIGQLLQNITSPVHYVAYAGGFAIGTFAGIRIEEKLALGVVLVRVITRHDASRLLARLRDEGFGITHVDAHGASGAVHVIFSLAKRSETGRLVSIITEYNPNAFYSVEDVRFVSDSASLASGASSGLLRRLIFPKKK